MIARIAIVLALVGCQSSKEPVASASGSGSDSGSGSGSAKVVPVNPGVGASQREKAPKLPDPLPGKRLDATFAGTAYRAAIGDLDGDGKNEIVLGDAKQLRVLSASGTEIAAIEVSGGVQVLAIANIDHDKTAEIYVGFGLTRDHRDAKARVYAYRLDRGKLVEEVVLAPATTRQDITAIIPIPEESAIVVAYFESKYMVKTAKLQRDSKNAKWTVFDIATLRTATAYARGDVDGDGKPDLVVGRVYGDDKAADGDALVLAGGGARTKLPTLRGVRELAIADADGDGRPEIYLADGWHQNYGQNARGLLTQVRFVDGAYKAEVVEDMPGQFTAGRIVPADVDGDGKPELVTTGSTYVRVFDRVANHWRALSIAGLVRDVATGELDGKPGDEILILGDKSEIVSLSASDFR